jgi:hypothetical protein
MTTKKAKKTLRAKPGSTMSHKRMYLSTWEKLFIPEKNHITKNGDTMFGIDGDEYEYVKETLRKSPHRVWTLVDGYFGGNCFIVEGWHFVNRLGYYITKNPYDPDSTYEVK